MPSDFHHVSNALLRRILETPARQLKPSDVQQALGWSLDALGRDAVRDDVPVSAFEARRTALREAVHEAQRGRKARAHAALVKFWLT